MAKISTDAGSYVHSANTPEKLKLIQGIKHEPELNRPAAVVPANTGTAQTHPEREKNTDDFIQTIEEANKRYDAYNKILQFSVHEKTRQIVIKIINTETEEVIAEIPPEKILDMIAQLWEMAGLLVDKRA
jgi:flagellar protein FlaG